MGLCSLLGFWLETTQGFMVIPWRRKWQPTPVSLPGKSHGLRTEEPSGLQSFGSQRFRHNWVTNTYLLTLSSVNFFILLNYFLKINVRECYYWSNGSWYLYGLWYSIAVSVAILFFRVMLDQCSQQSTYSTPILTNITSHMWFFLLIGMKMYNNLLYFIFPSLQKR